MFAGAINKESLSLLACKCSNPQKIPAMFKSLVFAVRKQKPGTAVNDNLIIAMVLLANYGSLYAIRSRFQFLRNYQIAAVAVVPSVVIACVLHVFFDSSIHTLNGYCMEKEILFISERDFPALLVFITRTHTYINLHAYARMHALTHICMLVRTHPCTRD